MNNSTVMRLLKCIVLAGALILPAVSWADDHLLSINGMANGIPTAVITDAGAVKTPLTLAAAGFPLENADLVFTSATPLTVKTALVQICAIGTGGLPEWLDQGNSVVSVKGTLTATGPTTGNLYTLTLDDSVFTDLYPSAVACTSGNQRATTYTYTPTTGIVNTTANTVVLAAATAPAAPPASGTYNFWNTSATVPEPGTLFLLLIGMLGLGWMSMKRKNQVQRANV